MTLTAHEAGEFSRAAKAMYSRGANELGHLLSAVAAKKTVPLSQYDRAAGAYRAWLVFDEPRKKNPARGLTTRVQAARGLFKSFTGAAGKPAGYVEIPDDDVLVIVGNCEAIAYNAVRGGTRRSYQHEFAKKSRPLLAVSSDGNRLYLIAGSYKFTERGIVDR